MNGPENAEAISSEMRRVGRTESFIIDFDAMILAREETKMKAPLCFVTLLIYSDRRCVVLQCLRRPSWSSSSDTTDDDDRRQE